MKKILFSLVATSAANVFALCPNLVSGHGEASNYNKANVVLPCQMADTNYTVVITANEFNGYPFYSSHKSLTGFTVGATSPGYDANRFDWIAVHN